MSATRTHYDEYLGPVYVWMSGGIEAALARGEGEIRDLGLEAPATDYAVDLGAGFGMHAIPLARRGIPVLAIDVCVPLLDELKRASEGLPIKALAGDLLDFRRHLENTPRAILCMGDTLTHLPSRAEVERLFSEAAEALPEGGQLILSFRDYTRAHSGAARFIPVRSDGERILTCFLEYGGERVTVHDLLHEREGAGWKQRVSAYEKLRLDPAWVVEALAARGFTPQRGAGLSGMVRIAARRG